MNHQMHQRSRASLARAQQAHVRAERSSQRAAAGDKQPADDMARPWCTQCDTDEYLILETIENACHGEPGLAEVSYTCAECDSYYAHAVGVESLDPSDRMKLPPLVLGGRAGYLHCGEVMTAGAGDELRCRCGFHMVASPTDPELDGWGWVSARVSPPAPASSHREFRVRGHRPLRSRGR